MWIRERQKTEAQEIIARLEKRKENLMIENDKLKSERLGKKPFYSGAVSSNSAMTRYATSGKYKENSTSSKISMIGDKGLHGNLDYGIKPKSVNKFIRSSLMKGAEHDINPVSYTHLTLPTTPYV
eukprot:TRINITY_DN5513_c0_g1_i2.p1 TRINITY_DN5513_c0_g1~~TRINITY_DN5513_c0_g1_i2.p1  ORF type:complete len:125 (-),score=26.62 TRINITY_DN5513_c0_g1_i2:34-408(-)